MQRIKTLSVILLLIFVGNIYQGAVLPFIEGIKYGLTISNYQIDNNQKTDNFVMMDVVPKFNNYLDNSEKNMKTGEDVLIRTNNLTVMVNSMSNKPFWWNVLQSFYGLLTLVTLALSSWIPFLAVSVIRSLQHSRVFDRQNLIRINRIGIILISVGVLETIIQSVNILMAMSLIDLTHYSFSFEKVIDFNPLMIGVIVLIMNEILRLGTVYKEEQDLTI
jgi:hypothetical protein